MMNLKKKMGLTFQKAALHQGKASVASPMDALGILGIKVERLGVVDQIPQEGTPLFIVANHIGDGDAFALLRFVEQTRSDYLIFGSKAYLNYGMDRTRLLAMTNDGSPESTRQDAAQYLRAIRHLKKGGCVAIFPSIYGLAEPRGKLTGPLIDTPWATLPVWVMEKIPTCYLLPLHFELPKRPWLQAAKEVARRKKARALESVLGVLKFASMVGQTFRIHVHKPYRLEDVPEADREPSRLLDRMFRQANGLPFVDDLKPQERTLGVAGRQGPSPQLPRPS